MTRQEARDYLEQYWWKGHRPEKPEGRQMIVGDLYEETPHDYGFYACPCETGETPPEDLEDWDVWYVSKNGDGCGVHLQ
jgi:hypothetical protein